MDYLRRRLSDGNFLAGGGMGVGGGDLPGVGRSPRPPTKAPVLLVIAPPGTDWVKLFKGKSVHGDVELRVEQAQFSELSLVASTHGALSVAIDDPRGGSRRFRPDFVLVREAPGGAAESSPRRLLAALQMGGVPCSDPLPALYGFAHPPCLFAHLAKLQRELGPEGFPLLPLRFCNRPRGVLSSPSFPLAVRLSPSPSGVGQVRVGTPQALAAVAAAMESARAGALLQQVAPGSQRLRLQRIGGASRGLQWPPVAAGDPPGDAPGEAQAEPLALSPRHRDWLDACARLFGGVDICGVEALRGPDGSEGIVEVLGSWLPLVGPGVAEDQQRIVELVLGRMRAELPRPPGQSHPRPRPQSSAPLGSPQPGTPPQQRPTPQGAPQSPGPAHPRPVGGGASPGPAQPRAPTQPRPQAQPPSPQLRPQTPHLAAQPRPQAPTTSPQPRPQAPATSPQPRRQTPPLAAQPRPQSMPTSPQPRPQASPTSPQLHPQAPPTGGQTRPQAPPPGTVLRPQTSPTSQPRPQASPISPQLCPQAPPTGGQPYPQTPAPATKPRPQAPISSPQLRPQPPPSSGQPRPQTPAAAQPRPQAPPTSPQPRPLGAQAPPTMRQPRPQGPPIAPKPILAPKPGGAPSPSPAPEQAGSEGIRTLRQSFASLFAD